MIKAAVLGSPISHSLSPLLHQTAYSILGVMGEYSAVEVRESELLPFLADSLLQSWSGFNLTMPLKEEVFSSPIVFFDEASKAIKSANTLVRDDSGYRATSTDLTAFERLLAPREVERVAIIGGGGTARAALGALKGRTDHVDILLRNPDRITPLAEIDSALEVRALPFASSLEGYAVVINTTPAGAADHFALTLNHVDGLLVESLYNPWPTELAFAWQQLGGELLHGIDLLVEQALDAISLITGISFDYADMRKELLTVALTRLHSQSAG